MIKIKGITFPTLCLSSRALFFFLPILPLIQIMFSEIDC